MMQGCIQGAHVIDLPRGHYLLEGPVSTLVYPSFPSPSDYERRYRCKPAPILCWPAPYGHVTSRPNEVGFDEPLINAISC